MIGASSTPIVSVYDGPQTRRFHSRGQARLRGSVSLKPGGLYHAIIQHDSWCAIYQGGCNCTPDISVCGDDAVTIIDEEGIGTKVKRS
jgi:hypothetical protein